MVTNYTGVKWTKEFGKEIVEKYIYARKIFLENTSKNAEEIEIIKNIEHILDNLNFKDSKEFDEFLEKNKIMKYIDDVEFNIRGIVYTLENGKFKIQDCAVLFLMNEENEFWKFLKCFTNKANVGKIKLEFPEVKLHDEIRENCIETVKELLEIGQSENTLMTFFEDKTVIYSEEIGFNELGKLRKANTSKHSFSYPDIKGIVLLFICPGEIGLDKITELIKDANFFVGAKNYTDTLYDVKIDKDCKEPKIKAILVV